MIFRDMRLGARIGSGLLYPALVLTHIGCLGSTQKPTDNSATKIVGGTKEMGHPEVLVAFTERDAQNKHARTCSAVAISDSVVLLASHCITDKTLKEGVSVQKVQNGAVSGGEIVSRTIVTYEALRGTRRITPVSARYDIAAVVYPKGTFKNYVEVATSSAAEGDLVKLVGYGASSFTDMSDNVPLPDRKRSGLNKLVSAKDGLLYIYGNMNAKDLPNNAVAAVGDSGAPVYKGNQLVGLTVGLYFSDSKGVIPITDDASSNPVLPLSQATFAGNAIIDLTSQAARAVIDAAKSGDPKKLVQPAAETINPANPKLDQYLAICFSPDMFKNLGSLGGGNLPLGDMGGMFQKLLGAFGGAWNNSNTNGGGGGTESTKPTGS